MKCLRENEDGNVRRLERSLLINESGSIGIKLKKLLVVASILLLASSLLVLSSTHTDLRVAAIGTPDAYGNVIMYLAVYQHNGTHWVLLLNHTSDSNWTQRVEDSDPINITVKWRLNNTLAASEAQAVSYTRVLMNISTVWTNEELNNTSTDSDATYYYGIEEAHWNHTGKPEAAVDYDVATKYEAYY